LLVKEQAIAIETHCKTKQSSQGVLVEWCLRVTATCLWYKDFMCQQHLSE